MFCVLYVLLELRIIQVPMMCSVKKKKLLKIIFRYLKKILCYIKNIF